MSGNLSVIDVASVGPAEQAAQASWFSWSDWAGMVASIGCAIHCAAMPFVIAYLPALGLSFLADEAFHKWMAVGCFIIALTAFVPGLRKHGRFTPVIIGSVGLVLISIAAFGFAGECCAACEGDAASVAAGADQPTNEIASSGIAGACADACCPHCASEIAAASEGDFASAESEVGEETTASELAVAGEENAAVVDTVFAKQAIVDLPTPPTGLSQMVGRIAPWLTPVGGIVLVVAHLLNRRYGCLCGCCSTEVAKATA